MILETEKKAMAQSVSGGFEKEIENKVTKRGSKKSMRDQNILSLKYYVNCKRK